MKTLINRRRHPVDLADGTIVPAYGTGQGDPDDPRNAALIDAGVLGVADEADEPSIDVGRLSVDKLVAVLDADTEAYADAGRVEVPAALDELRQRAANGVQSARAALESRNLNPEESESS